MRILLLEDDRALQKGITLKLTKEGHEVAAADSICGARSLDFSPQTAILDINLPDGSGLDFCKELRQKLPLVHIIMLTARDSETDTVLGYDFGADDYVTKPFSLSVLLSKIAAVNRRQSGEGEIEIEDLTKNERRLLQTFMRHAGQTLTKEQLLNALWDINGNFVHENTLAVNISRLREKLESQPQKQLVIENVRGIGYRLKSTPTR